MAQPPLGLIHNQMVAVVPDEALVGICDGLDTGQVMRSHALHHTELSKPVECKNPILRIPEILNVCGMHFAWHTAAINKCQVCQ